MKKHIALASFFGLVIAGGFLAIALGGCESFPGSEKWRRTIFATAPDAPQPAPVTVRP